MTGGLYFDTYDSGLGREQMLCAGRGVQRLLIVPPLFDELNRLRRTLVMAMRVAHESYNISTCLPDLPGQNESQTPLSQRRLSDWHCAMQNAATQVAAMGVVSIRSACLLDTLASDPYAALPRWRYVPMAGERLVTQLLRTQLASDKAAGVRSTRATYEPDGDNSVLNIGGYTLSAGLLRDLAKAEVTEAHERTDIVIEKSIGPALWLRNEPGESAELAKTFATHWSEWLAG